MFQKISLGLKGELLVFVAAFLFIAITFLCGYVGYILGYIYKSPMLIVICGFVGLIIGGIIRLMILGYIHDINYFQGKYSK